MSSKVSNKLEDGGLEEDLVEFLEGSVEDLNGEEIEEEQPAKKRKASKIFFQTKWEDDQAEDREEKERALEEAKKILCEAGLWRWPKSGKEKTKDEDKLAHEQKQLNRRKAICDFDRKSRAIVNKIAKKRLEIAKDNRLRKHFAPGTIVKTVPVHTVQTMAKHGTEAEIKS
ncbi:unnamed protein product, partial [Amoebophrya sp. A25]|eukprot:GSA25T00020500001.1